MAVSRNWDKYFKVTNVNPFMTEAVILQKPVHWHGAFIVNFDHVSHFFLVFVLLSLNQ